METNSQEKACPRELAFPKAVTGIMETLRKTGSHVMAAGLCVRDTVMGGEPTIWDLYCNLPRDQVVSCLDAAEKDEEGAIIRVKETERQKGLWIRVHSLDFPFTDFLMEQDFTINAIGYDPKWGYIDPTGGLEDLEEGILRTTGNPADLFMEDAEAMFRAVGLAATYDLILERNTRLTIKRRARGMQDPSKVVRVKLMDGLVNMLVSKNAGKAMRLMLELDLLEATVGGSRWTAQEFKDSMLRLSEKIDETVDEMKVRAGLFYLTMGEKPGTTAVKFLPYEAETEAQLCMVLRLLPQLDQIQTRTEMKRLMGRLGESPYEYLEMMAEAAEIALGIPNKNKEKRRELAEEIIASGEPLYRKDLAVGLGDLRKAGMEPEEAEKMIPRILEQVHLDPKMNDKETLLAWARRQQRKGLFSKWFK